nr:acyl-CoA-binding domain-containing protein 4 [Ipomoea trifida]
MGTDSQSWYLDLSYDQWTALSVSGPHPAARYKHAATVLDGKLYIAGGSRNGRYLSDIQVFDLKSLAWSTIKSDTEVLPALSGHSVISWGHKLLLLAGHSRSISDTVTVWIIDPESQHCSIMETFGTPPVARGGQSVTLFGSKLIMFGGEDKKRRLLNDIYVLDLETQTWSSVETTQTPPSPRFDHSAALHAERYLLIFGGCSHSVFFNDLHILDLETMEWSCPQLQGDLVSSRAGHAGVTIDENWYIVGGGDNKSGVPETLVLNMSKLVVSVLTSVKGRDPLASEGLTVSSALLDGEHFLVAFGGYNGKYSNEVYVMRLKPRDSLHPKILMSPAAAAAAASVTAAYALTKPEVLDLTEREDSNFKEVQNDTTRKDLSAEINAIREEKKVLESSLAEVAAENSAVKAKIEEVNNTHADLSKEFHSVQGQLTSERSRCAKLEAQIAELRKVLDSMQSVEEEVQALRRQKSALEHDMELQTVQGQRPGGVWKWIAG